MEAKKTILEVGLEKGYLRDEKIYLKPVIKSQPMLVQQKGHKMEFMGDECTWAYQLGVDKWNNLVNPFNSEEERKFFEEIMGRSLNPRDIENNYWCSNEGTVKIKKSQELMAGRVFYDLANPEDNLRWRVLKSCIGDFAQSKEDYDINPFRKFILVSNDHELNEDSKKLDDEIEVYLEIGKIKNSKTDMIKFLTMFNTLKKNGKLIPDDNTKEWYDSEVVKALKTDFEICRQVVSNKDRDIMALISSGLVCGAIERKGVASFTLPGWGEIFPMTVFISKLREMKEYGDPLYLQLVAQTEAFEGNKKKKTTTK